MTAPEIGYIARRILSLVPVWLGISLLAFSLANLAPGDPAQLILLRQTGELPTEEAVQRLREQLGLDDPFPVRYARWLADAAQGDLGTSYRTGEPVLGALLERFPATLQLAVAALLIGLSIGIPLGVLSAVRRDSGLDHASRVGVLLGASIPNFWLGYLFILLFAVVLGWLPVAGAGSWQHLVLPALTLGVGGAASLTRLTRSTVLEELQADYVRTARAKGLAERAVVMRHALRNALNPIVTLTGMRFGGLLAGAVVVETVFAWPGIGKFLVDAIYDRDYPTIQGFVLFTGTVFVLLNLLVDLGYAWLDPRVRLTGGEGRRGGR
ncbi:MAG: ABC transporter permease [Gemmatimonadota bacterium]|nr:ABC transporter permease [Gemmatimonadota bacterium]